MTRAGKLWMAAGVAVVLTVAAYFVVALNYQLEHGDTWNVGQGAVLENSNHVAVHELHAGNKVQIAITIRNPGPLPVIVDETALGGPDIVVDEVTMIERAGGSDECCRPQEATPFHPVRLAYGDQVMVWLALRVTGANPYWQCTEVALESASIRYQVMGVRRLQQLRLPTKIAFRAPCQ